MKSLEFCPQGIWLPDGHYLPPIAGGADGDPPPDPKPDSQPKMVPESDLIAAKAGLQKDIDTSRAELRTLREQLGRETASKTELEAKLTEQTTLQEKLTQLEKDHAESKTALEAAQKRLLDSKIQSLVAKGLKKESVEKRTEAELDAMLEALTLVPSRQYDNGGGKGAGDKSRPRDLYRQALEEGSPSIHRIGGKT